ncbi:polysaccharide pyruvyl transferase family protein [Dermabacteraceae bacterium P7074]
MREARAALNVFKKAGKQARGKGRRYAASFDRVAQNVLHPNLWPTCKPVNAYYWTEVRNFGDLITPFLFRKAGIAPVLKSVDEADVVGVGSIIEHLPESFSGIIWGSGKMFEDRPVNLPQAEVVGVRGELTKAAISPGKNIFLGDPGLLMGEFLSRPKKRDCLLGVIPHYFHINSPWVQDLKKENVAVKVIDVRNSPIKVAREIASCENIFSTSLHGLILADSLGIPAAWALPEPILWGADFKFRDYESVVDPEEKLKNRRVIISEITSVSHLLALVDSPSADIIADTRKVLLKALSDLGEAIDSPTVPPVYLPFM